MKEFDRENTSDVTEDFINLQDWMAKIQEIVLRLGFVLNQFCGTTFDVSTNPPIL